MGKLWIFRNLILSFVTFVAMGSASVSNAAILPSEDTSERCRTELSHVYDFADREENRLHELLANLNSDIDLLGTKEKLRAKTRWFEADSSRRRLRKTLDGSNLNSNVTNIACAQTTESIRASLFESQQLSFNLSLDYDHRAQTMRDDRRTRSVR